MKYKHKLENLVSRIKQFDSFPKDIQNSLTRPGSQKK